MDARYDCGGHFTPTPSTSTSTPTGTGGYHPGHSLVLVQKKSQSWEVSTYGKIYCAIVLLEVLAIVALAGLSLWYTHTHASDDTNSSSIQYTAILAVVTAIALLYFCVDSIVLENVFQFYVSQILHGMLTGYVIWHYLGNGDDLGEVYNRVSLWVMIGVCVFQAAYLGLILPVQRQFGWRLYKKVGGNVAIRPLYRDATIFFSLLKLDFALGLILVLLAVFYLISDPLQIALNSLACFFTLLWLIIGFTFVQRESNRLAILFFAFGVLEPAYILYKLIAMRVNNPPNSDLDNEPYPVFSWNQFLATGCIAVIVRLSCILYGFVCMRNFGKGLKEKMWSHSPARRRHLAEQAPQHAQGDQAGYATVTIGQPVVLVTQGETEDISSMRSYIQPLL